MSVWTLILGGILATVIPATAYLTYRALHTIHGGEHGVED